jgi:hypothetical protein
MGFTMNGGFAKLHPNGLRWFDWLGGTSDFTNCGTVFLWLKTIQCIGLWCFLEFTMGEL